MTSSVTDLEKYVIARWAYSIGKPIISDVEYNLLHTMMQATDPNNEYVQRSWSSDPCPTELLNKYNLGNLITAVVVTDKTESIPSLNSFAEIRQVYGELSEECTLSYKHDGWNFQVSYYNGRKIHSQTRGRTSDAMVVESLDSLLPERIDMMGKVTIIAEITASHSAFRFAKQKFGNVSQRGCVSTFLANREYAHMLSLHAFRIRSAYEINDHFKLLREWGYDTPMNTRVSSFSELMEKVKEYSDFNSQYDFPTDGLVVAGDITRALRVMAWEEPIHNSYITGYKEEFGPQYTSVGLEIFPIKLPNSEQKNIPATNLSRVIALNLQPGAPVAFRIASSAIADLDDESTKLLHKTYVGRWEEFQMKVEENERIKLTME